MSLFLHIVIENDSGGAVRAWIALGQTAGGWGLNFCCFPVGFIQLVLEAARSVLVHFAGGG